MWYLIGFISAIDVYYAIKWRETLPELEENPIGRMLIKYDAKETGEKEHTESQWGFFFFKSGYFYICTIILYEGIKCQIMTMVVIIVVFYGKTLHKTLMIPQNRSVQNAVR